MVVLVSADYGLGRKYCFEGMVISKGVKVEQQKIKLTGILLYSTSANFRQTVLDKAGSL